MAGNVSERESRQVAEAAREREWRLPSFGRELYLGDFRLDLIHPQPPLEREAVERGERFLDRLRSFLEERVDPAAIERDAKVPDEVVEGLKGLGAMGMKVPERYGGLGLTQVYYNRALTLGASCHPAISTLLSAHQSIGVAEPLLLFGSEEQKREWLPRVSSTHISAFLLTEPDVGSDPAGLATTATPTGDGYRISGRKLWATNGVIADVVVVMAKAPGGEGHPGGISAFVLPYDQAGVKVEHRNQFMGLRGIENSVTRLDEVFVPNENLIGREGEGLKIALTTLNTGRLALPAICLGTAKWALRVAREWAGERVQWGQPIGKHEAVAHKLAFIAASVFGLEAMLDVASRLADAGKQDIRIEAAIAKLYGSELGWRIVDDLVQIRGGRGYETAQSLAARGEKPVPAEQALRDMRINRIFEGSTEIMHLLIAREAVDQHLQVAGDLLEPEVELRDRVKAGLGAGAFYARWLPGLVVGEGQRPGSYEEFAELATHLRFVERSSRKLARSTFYGIGRWQAALEKREAFLGRVVDIGAELFAIASACVYARGVAADQPGGGGEARELADLFCRQARRRVEALFHGLWANDDPADYDAGQRILDGRYRWLEEGVIDPSGEGPMIGAQPESVEQAPPAEPGEEEAPAASAKAQ